MAKNVQNNEKIDENVYAADNVCIICCHSSDLFCVGHCDHPVCFECATRLRVLCDSKECSICRAEIDTIYVLHCRPKSASLYNEVVVKRNQRFITSKLGRKYGFVFESQEANNAVADLLTFICTMCKHEVEFENFDSLSRHMRREHGLFFCELCVEHLMLFPWERKFYSRPDLARHKRLGDLDDKSHKGHPLCQYCDERFLDSDFLFRHLRRDHYFCHFCDADGKNKFYKDISVLKDHLKQEHYLCEIGQCKDEELGISFRNEIDFKAHKATMHARDMQKGDLKKELQVNLSFNYGPKPLRERFVQQHVKDRRERSSPDFGSKRPINGPSGAAGPLRSCPLNPLADELARRPASTDATQPSSSSFDLTSQDFPSLGGKKLSKKLSSSSYGDVTKANRSNEPTKAPSSDVAGFRSLANVVDRSFYGASDSNAVADDDFPALGQTSGRRRRGVDDRSSTATLNGQEVALPPKFVLIDDDEATKSWKTSAAAPKQANKPIVLKPKSDASGSSGWVQPKIAGISAAEFPGLPEPAKSARPKSDVAPKSDWGKKSASEPKSKKPQPPVDAALSMKAIGEILEMQTLPKSKAKTRVMAVSKSSCPKNAELVVESSPPAAPLAPKPISELVGPPALKNILEPNGPPALKNIPEPVGLPALKNISEPVGPPPGLGGPPPRATQPSDVAPPPGFEISSSTRDIDVSNFQYAKAPNFAQRNKALMELLQRSLGQEQFGEFKTLSHGFRRRTVAPSDYYDRVRTLLGPDLFMRSFTELLRLLPDITLQNELLSLYSAGGLDEFLAKCQLCCQILAPADLTQHLSHHLKSGAQEEYPPLR